MLAALSARKPAMPGARESVVTDKFFITLFTVLALTLISGATACLIAIKCPDPAGRPMQAELFKSCLAIFQTGVGAIIGLLGGHAL